MGLFDYEFRLEEINKKQPPLQKLNTVIDWELFRRPIEKALTIPKPKPCDRPHFGYKNHQGLLNFNLFQKKLKKPHYSYKKPKKSDFFLKFFIIQRSHRGNKQRC